jgi:hypothetical protein
LSTAIDQVILFVAESARSRHNLGRIATSSIETRGEGCVRPSGKNYQPCTQQGSPLSGSPPNTCGEDKRRKQTEQCHSRMPLSGIQDPALTRPIADAVHDLDPRLKRAGMTNKNRGCPFPNAPVRRSTKCVGGESRTELHHGSWPMQSRIRILSLRLSDIGAQPVPNVHTRRRDAFRHAGVKG